MCHSRPHPYCNHQTVQLIRCERSTLSRTIAQ
uniref:Uncharacterized protein n=1 Tax=Anguilla anguilla TaxID=7936 RepID=A0A0E9QSK2_ANGAN